MSIFVNKITRSEILITWQLSYIRLNRTRKHSYLADQLVKKKKKMVDYDEEEYFLYIDLFFIFKGLDSWVMCSRIFPKLKYILDMTRQVGNNQLISFVIFCRYR